MMTPLDTKKVEKLRKELEGKNKTESRFEVQTLCFPTRISFEIVCTLFAYSRFDIFIVLHLTGRKERNEGGSGDRC